MCPGNVSAGEEADRLQVAWIRRIENRYSVAEHVADIKMPAVEHDLNTIRPSANIAVKQMTEALSGALRLNCTFLRARLPGAVRQCCETNQASAAIAPTDRPHFLLRFLNLDVHVGA